MCASCSQVNPIPPSVCTQSFAFANAASNAKRGRGGDGEIRPGRGHVARGACRVPHRGACEFGARQHLGAPMLDALELPDRPSELHAHLRVLRRGVDAPLRDPDRLRREQHRRHRAHLVGRDIELAFGRRHDVVELEPRDSPGRIDARDLGRRNKVRIECEPRAADLAHDHVGEVTADRDPAVERDRAHRGAVHERGRERGRDRRGHVRARRARAPELFDDDGLLDERGAAPAVRLVDVESEPARLDDRRPERRDRFGVGVERGPRDRRVDS